MAKSKTSMERHIWANLTPAEQEGVLARPLLGHELALQEGTRSLLARVRLEGDAALRALTAKFDGVEIHELRVSPAEIHHAEAALGSAALEAIDQAIANVRAFHQAQMPNPVRVQTAQGVVCERQVHALDAVGLYVPAGTAPLPSAAIMLAVPAAIAGCPVRVMATPPRADGRIDPGVAVAAKRAGINHIIKVGGAQAIAALAYGTESVPRVNKIFGPGNAWVTMAKTLVAAEPGGPSIDMPAGPSEVLVIADAQANPHFVAADLLSQAEHGTDSQVILVTNSNDLATAVEAALAHQLTTLSRAHIARDALTHSRCIIVADMSQAITVSNQYAPEHLILQCDNAGALVTGVRNAGSVFVGPWSPESVGDYCSGTNHVLPTYGHARSYSGLGVDQFVRFMTIQTLSREGLAGLAPTVTTLASLEGLDAHARAVEVRLKDNP